MKKTKLGKHEQSCWDEVVMLDIDEIKIRSLCKKARKLDEDGVSFPLPPPNLYFEYWDIRKTARERKKSMSIRKNQEITISKRMINKMSSTQLFIFVDIKYIVSDLENELWI